MKNEKLYYKDKPLFSSEIIMSLTLEFLFCLATKTNILSRVKALTIDVNMIDRNGMTPLIHATRRGFLDVVKYLVEEGADINKKNKYGETPLMEACAYGQFEVAEFLLVKGANINYQNPYNGFTPLLTVTRRFRCVYPLIELLLKWGADPNICSATRYTPLMYACYKVSRLETLKLLVRSGADIRAQNATGDTPLKIAKTTSEEFTNYIERVLKNPIFPLRSLCIQIVYRLRLPHSHLPRAFFEII